MRLLYESPYARLEADDARHLVRFTRTDVPFPTVEDAANTFRALAHTPTDFDRTEYVLLTDLRSAHGRNDPGFEQAIARYRSELFAGFSKRATLVKTMAGALQVQRLGREQHAPEVRVFQDEVEAMAYLLGK